MTMFKSLFTASLVLSFLFVTSCSTRKTDIPSIISNIQTAMSNQDLSAFKKDIWADAADKKLMDAGTFSMSNLVYIAGQKYNYVFTTGSASIPETGADIAVTVPTTVTPGSTSGNSTFQMINISTLPFTETWKIKKITLIGVTTPVVSLPKFIEIKAVDPK